LPPDVCFESAHPDTYPAIPAVANFLHTLSLSSVQMSPDLSQA